MNYIVRKIISFTRIEYTEYFARPKRTFEALSGAKAPSLTDPRPCRKDRAMPKPLTIARFIAVCACVCLVGGQALAWGSSGHRLIGREALAALPSEAPAFVRSPSAIDAVGELAREPDRWKDSGKTHDSDRDPGHFLNLGDDGRIFGGPSLDALPETRAAYDTALRAVGVDSWKAGYLPYAIVDGWQQLTTDFAYWRVDSAAANGADRDHRVWFVADRARREALVLRDLGVLAHYVGDASQPLHVTVHFSGWGPWPNPEHYTQERIHAFFEGEFVRRHVDAPAVRAVMAPYADCRCAIAAWTSAYLSATNRQVVPFYQLQKAGGFLAGDPRGRDFAAARLAAGASALRDLVLDAWHASATGKVGWPAVGVADVEAGKVDPYDSLYGSD